MKVKKGILICGILLTVLVPIIVTPLFFLIGFDDLDSFGKGNSSMILIAGIVVIVLAETIGFIMIFGAVLIPLFKGMSAQNKILSQGQPAEALILALNDTGTRINHNPLVQFSLEVHSETQPPFRAEVSQTVSVIHLPSYQPGKIVNVKYVPGTDQVAIVGAKL